MKSENTQKSEVNNQFNNLVTNALDFLSKSIDEINASPKHTIIDFYTAVELLIKARLLREHWTLIIKKIESADFNKFLEGDFQSVSLEDGNLRLKKIIGEDVGDETYKQFDEIRKHRNQLVHFHYKNNNLKEIVARDILKGLYYLDLLLNNKWKPHFDNFKSEMIKISEKAHKLRDFLKAKFDILKLDIEKEKASGVFFDKCPSCGFASARKNNIFEKIFSSSCKVCGFEENCILVNCPDCSEKVFVSEGFEFCDFCNHSIEIGCVIDQFKPKHPYDKRSLEEYEYKTRLVGLCGECGWIVGDKTLYPMDQEFNKWFCISCNKIYDLIEECSMCGTLFPYDPDIGLICSDCS